MIDRIMCLRCRPEYPIISGVAEFFIKVAIEDGPPRLIPLCEYHKLAIDISGFSFIPLQEGLDEYEVQEIMQS